MGTYITKDRNNFYQLNWLDKFMMHHKGFIAGGCFKNIFEGKKVKDIDMFFESKDDWLEAVDVFDKRTKGYFDIYEPDEDDICNEWEEEYKFLYENEKVKAYIHIQSGTRIELCRAVFGKPEDVLNEFDFTITKFALYKEEVEDEPTDELEDEPGLFESSDTHIEYKVMFHKDFFEHLHMKRLVTVNKIPFPMSTLERMIRYIGYGYRPCRETKVKIATAIHEVPLETLEANQSLYDGWD